MVEAEGELSARPRVEELEKWASRHKWKRQTLLSTVLVSEGVLVYTCSSSDSWKVLVGTLQTRISHRSPCEKSKGHANANEGYVVSENTMRTPVQGTVTPYKREANVAHRPHRCDNTATG